MRPQTVATSNAGAVPPALTAALEDMGGTCPVALSAAISVAVITHLPSGVIVVDTDGTAVFTNAAGKRLSEEIGLCDSSMAGSMVTDQLYGSPCVTHGVSIAHALAGHTVPNADYVRGVPGEARYRVVQVAFTPLRDESTRTLGALLTLTDLTERVDGQARLATAADALAQVTRETLAREADTLARTAVSQARDNRDLTRSNTNLEKQATLARAAGVLAEDTRETLALEAGMLARVAVTQARTNRDLARSNTGLEQFASVASHDLQEPLRKIQAFGDRLKSVDGSVLSSAGTDYLGRMQHAAARMQILINDLLAYARVSAEPPSIASVDLGEITRAVLTDLEARVALVGGLIEVGPLPIIEGDPLRLRQLLQNLISNALKFRRPDVPPRIAISALLLPETDAENLDSVARWMCMTVQDNGIGFEQKHAERIFEVFKRLHGRSTYEGTGIGLALCRQIAEQHGGHIAATSAPGQGATLQIMLPLRHVEDIGTS